MLLAHLRLLRTLSRPFFLLLKLKRGGVVKARLTLFSLKPLLLLGLSLGTFNSRTPLCLIAVPSRPSLSALSPVPLSRSAIAGRLTDAQIDSW